MDFKFIYHRGVIFIKKKEVDEILDSMVVIVDTREQDRYIENWLIKKGHPVVRRKLDYGDYSFMIPKNEKFGIMEDVLFDERIAIERKNSLDEIISNLCDKNGERINKEFANYPGKMYLYIEDKYDNACLQRYRSKYNRRSLLGKLEGIELKYGIPVKFYSKESMPVKVYVQFRYYLKHKLMNNFDEYFLKSIDKE